MNKIKFEWKYGEYEIWKGTWIMLNKIAEYQKYAEDKLFKLNEQYNNCSINDTDKLKDIDRNIEYWRGQNDAYKKILKEITR